MLYLNQKDGTSKTTNEKGNMPEIEDNGNYQEVKPEKVAGKLLDDPKKFNASYFTNNRKNTKEAAQKETIQATSSKNNQEQQVEGLAQQGAALHPMRSSA